MNNLVLIKSAQFNNVPLDCYIEPEQDDNGNFWATREQIGRLLEYEYPGTSIGKIHERHQERLDKFSRVSQIDLPLGGTQEVFIYNFKGLLEICRYSNQPKADAVMDWLFDVADEIRRTGSYSIRKEYVPERTIPASTMKAAEKVLTRAFKCKTSEDFQTVLALDEIFKHYTGESALEIAGLKLVKKSGTKYYPIILSDGSRYTHDWTYEFYAWEHNFPPILDENANMPDFLRK